MPIVGASGFVRPDMDLIAPGRQLESRQEADAGPTDTLARRRLESQVELLSIAALHAGALVRGDDRHLDLFVEATVALLEFQ